MSNPVRTMKTRAKNATQHPGYAQRKPRQPADSNTAAIKARKAEAATAARAAAAVAKKVNSARLSKFEQEAMDLEDILAATPRPNFTPITSRALPSASEPSAAGSVIESEVGTDEVDLDKAMYNPGSTTEDDTESELSVLPTSPLKRTYAEVASSLHKGSTKPAASGVKAPPAAKPAKPAPAKLVAAQSKAPSDSATESDSTAPSRPFHPQPPAPSKQAQRVNPPPSTASETEPDSPPPKIKARALQRLGSFRDLGDLDESLRRPKPVPKKKPSGRKAVDLSRAMGKDESEATANPASGWRSWKIRHTDTEERMDLDLPARTSGAVPEKGKTEKKAKVNEEKAKAMAMARGKRRVYDQTMIILSESEVEIVEGGGKGKGKATEANLKSMEVDVEVGTSKFVVPTLLPGARKQPLPRATNTM